MNIKGKKIVCLGDSITAGAGASVYENCWVARLGALSGADVKNYGIGGTRIARQQQPSDPVYDQDYCLRAPQMDKDADVVIVFGGTNDYGHGDAEMGTFADQTPDTFCGALGWLFGYLKENFKNAEILVLTPLHRRNENNLRGDGSKKKDFYTLLEYVENIRIAAKNYGFNLLDLYSEAGMDPALGNDDATYFTDGLHPNDLGHEIIAKLVFDFLNKM